MCNYYMTQLSCSECDPQYCMGDNPVNCHCYQVAAILMVAQVTGPVGQTLLSDIAVTSWLLQQTLIASTSSYLQAACRLALVQAAHWRLVYSSPQLMHAA